MSNLSSLSNPTYFTNEVNGNGGNTITLLPAADGQEIHTVFGITNTGHVILNQNDVVEGNGYTLLWPNVSRG